MRNSRWAAFIALLFAFTLVAAACSGSDEGSTDTTEEGASDTTETTEGEGEEEPAEGEEEPPAEAPGAGGDDLVTVFGPESSEEEAGGIQGALDVFAEDKDYDIQYVGARDFSDQINVQGATNPPDIGVFPQPGKLREFAEEGTILELPENVKTTLDENWDESWKVFGQTKDGKEYGVPTKSDLKSLVWYQPSVFEEKGYEVPETWEDFLALADAMIEAGDTPLCVGIESGPATGWPFTDWTEDVILRTQGPDYYTQWVNHEIPFNDPGVVEAMQTILDLWEKPGAVFASGGSIAATPFAENAEPLLNNDCLMHRQANFFASNFPEGTELGPEGVDAFYLPGDGTEKPVLVAGTIAAAFTDRENVVEVLEYMATSDYANARAEAQPAGGYLTAAKNVDLSKFNEVEKGFLEILLNEDVIRFDASDQMPAAVGSGTFWSEGTAAVNGDKDAQAAADAIEESWPS